MSDKEDGLRIIIDGNAIGQIEFQGEATFRTLAEAACRVDEFRDTLKKHGVIGWGFDGMNFYVTTRRRRNKAFSENVQWYRSPMGEDGEKRFEFGSNPFDNLL